VFRPRESWVNFVLGTDQHGFLLGTVHGNGSMPFPHVTVDEVPIGAWSQLVVAKDAHGYQKFYRNGALVHTDRHATAAGRVRPFRDRDEGEPVRLAMPLGGLIGEAWVFPREVSADEVRKDFEAKRGRYRPALQAEPVPLREMDAHPAAGLWEGRGGPLDRHTWPAHRERILRGVRQVLGPMPSGTVPLEPRVLAEDDCGTFLRRKVSFAVQPGDRMPAYLLVPKGLKGRAPAVICAYGTTAGAGKETTVGLSGAKPGSPPNGTGRSRSTWSRPGSSRWLPTTSATASGSGPAAVPTTPPTSTSNSPTGRSTVRTSGTRCGRSTTSRLLDLVDGERVGMVGHSYGGHGTIFAAALEPRIKAAWANGPVSDFLHHGLHWAVPRGAGSSQSMPALRPYVLDHTLRPPVTFYEFTALVAPRPLAVGQAVGEWRPMEEEIHAAVAAVYRALGAADRVRYVSYAGDHDFPPEARQAAVA
jgi:hypothetical protein